MPRRIVLITGCSKGGIGYSLCEEFARHDCKVYASARRLESLEGLDSQISRLALNVTSDESVKAAVDTIIAAEGRIDVVVNNAGIHCPGALADIPIEDVARTFDANVYGILRVSQAVIPHMASRRSGRIVNIGSVVGHVATPWAGIYCATKAAVHSLTDALTMECQPFGIEVLLVTPGSVKSHFADNGTPLVKLPPNSLYHSYLDKIMRRLHSSQAPGTMPSEEFARQLVKAALKPKMPRYITLGGNSTTFALLRWMPRAFLLWFMWRRFG